MSKSKRAVIAKDTLEILKRGYYINEEGTKIDIQKTQTYSEENTYLYTPEELLELIETQNLSTSGRETIFEVTGETTLNAVRRLVVEGMKNVLCLNFASARNPGGGFLGGAQAQEESIARATGLYPCQLKASNYYETNRKTKTCLYTDHMIYSPKVPLIKNEAGDLLEKALEVSIITAPAVNTGVVKRREFSNIDKIEPTMRRRIDQVLAISKKHGHKVLVLGAWGCGVFQNDPREAALWFEEALREKYAGQFKRIVFAIYARNERFITPFRERFDK